jgi:hypothetical protein
LTSDKPAMSSPLTDSQNVSEKAGFVNTSDKSAAFPRYLPGEQLALAQVEELGAKFGYGNLISHLQDAWSRRLQEDVGEQSADMATGRICLWCFVDKRTGKKVE